MKKSINSFWQSVAKKTKRVKLVIPDSSEKESPIHFLDKTSFSSNNKIRVLVVLFAITSVIIYSCSERHSTETGITYTCPMPEDSVFSNKPGRCPKCGMDLVPVDESSSANHHHEGAAMASSGYSCPMHPQVSSETPDTCPICGMNLERVKTDNEPLSLSLEMLLKPANQAVVANVPMVHMAQREEDLELDVLGVIEYDPDYSKKISSRVSGRITKMFVKYRYQKIKAGQPLMEVYSQDLVTAQNNYLFLLKNDAANQSMIAAAKERLLLLGVSASQVNEIAKKGKALYSVTIYSTAGGLIDEANTEPMETGMQNGATAPLILKEGMYVNKGQALFKLFNPAKARIALQIFPQHQDMLKAGDKVRIQPEANPEADFRATIQEIIPYYQPQSKTLIARIPFDNSLKNLPAGSTAKVIVFTGYKNANWLPEEAVTSLGLDKVVFVREQDGFIARKVKTGIVSKHLIQIIEGLEPNKAVAANAGFLVDSESFIMTKNEKP